MSTLRHMCIAIIFGIWAETRKSFRLRLYHALATMIQIILNVWSYFFLSRIWPVDNTGQNPNPKAYTRVMVTTHPQIPQLNVTKHGQFYTIDVSSARLFNRGGLKFNTSNTLPKELKLCLFLIAPSIFQNFSFVFTIVVVVANIFHSSLCICLNWLTWIVLLDSMSL